MEIVNKVSQSGLVTINLEDYFPVEEMVLLDIRSWLFEDMILKEKDFREYIKQHNWQQYTNKYVAVTCSADAIIPTWAYMLVAAQLAPVAKAVYFGNEQQMQEAVFHSLLTALDPETYKDQRIVIKGCSDREVPVSAYMELTRLLQPHVKSIMYGEPCSTVPVYKRKD